MSNQQVELTVEHHALLFGLIARSVIKEFGPSGEVAIAEYTLLYSG